MSTEIVRNHHFHFNMAANFPGQNRWWNHLPDRCCKDSKKYHCPQPHNRANIWLYLVIDYPFVSLITNLNMLKSMMASVNVLGTYESHNWITHFLRAWFLNPQYSVYFQEIWVLLGSFNLLILHFHDTQNTICTLIYNIHGLKTHSYTKSKLLLTKLRETM